MKFPDSKLPFVIRLPRPDFHESSTLSAWLLARFEGYGSNGSAGVSSSTIVTVAEPSVQPGAWAVMTTERWPFTSESSVTTRLKAAEVWPAGMMTMGGAFSVSGSLVSSDTTRLDCSVPEI